MAVLRPLEVVIDNWPTDDDGEPVVEQVELINNPENADDGTRTAPFSGRFWIEQDDFKAEPPPKYYRLHAGREVRLRGAFFVTCDRLDTDDDGNVERVHVTYDPETRGGNAPDGRKVKSTMHWVSAAHAVDAQVALYERLFAPRFRARRPVIRSTTSTRTHASCSTDCKVEPALGDATLGRSCSSSGWATSRTTCDAPLLFHRTVGLRDEWANIQKRKG